jgi:hypothetical protein
MSADIITQEHNFLLQTLMRHASQYYELRVAQMYRSRPGLRGHLDDLNFLLMTNLKLLLGGSKPFGGERRTVCWLVFGDDITKRKALLNPTDQVTLLNEVVEKEDDNKKQTAGMGAIKSIRTLFSHIDSSLDSIVQTLQSFLWIETPDVFDIAVVDVASGYLGQILQARGVPDNLKPCLNHSLRRALDEPVQLEEALLTYYHRLRRAATNFQHRFEDAKPFSMVIRREMTPQGSEEAHRLIMECAQHLSNAAGVHKAGAVSPEAAQHYARIMGAAPEQITVERVVGWESAQLTEKKKTLMERLETATAGGHASDMKALQAADANRKLEMFGQHLTQAGVDLSKDPPKLRQDD